MVVFSEDEYLANQGVIQHYGTPRHSGRYPWGSGDDPASQRNHTLASVAEDMRRQGMKDPEIARGLGITTTQLRDIRSVTRNERKQVEIALANKLKEKGMSNIAIAKQMTDTLGYKVGDTQVGAILKPSQERKAKILDNITDTLRKAVDEKGYVDVGSGVDHQLNVTSTKLRAALKKLQDEGYRVHNDIKIEQVTTGNFTNLKILTKPGTEWGDVMRNRDKIQQVNAYSEDGGRTILGIVPPLSISSKRVAVRYADQGGKDADGVIYVRPGVKDVELGSNRYAQVRIAVDDTHYLKGMAVYKDNLPAGVDLMFNTNKSDTGNKLDAMKPLKTDKKTGAVDQDNPFGATVKQIGVVDPATGHKKLTSVMNIVNKEGQWDEWSKNLPSQVLSKQRPFLAKEQLDLTYTTKKSDLEGILALTNPSVKKKLLQAYADGVDTAAVHLKAAHLPRQRTRVILPIPELKDTEVYAPGFRDGEPVALVRFPHGGTFEIPELKVNNKNPAGKKLLGEDSKDAIGIHPKVAERLSGADFDGDTVLVIPNGQGKIKSTSPLEGLRNFDPKESYPYYEGMKKMTDREKGLEMGKVSNLITDMTIQHAGSDEIVRAVKHSMVVIDAEKHSLDFRRSERENGIAALKKKYQSNSKGLGASTLISRAKSEVRVPDRKLRSAQDGGPIDLQTGKKVYVPTGKTRTYVGKDGKTHTVLKEVISTKLAEADDAHTLSSGTYIEKVYGDHSNRLKALANEARKELVRVKSQRYVSSARIVHKDSVQTLNDKLSLALKNAPLERQAQVIANATVRLKLQSNPELRDKDSKVELKRLKSQALAEARMRTGADKQKFEITDAEWAAIQAGAITAHKLDQILTYADLKRIRELATPRVKTKITPANVNKAKALRERDYSWAEIADALGVSVSAIREAVGGESN